MCQVAYDLRKNFTLATFDFLQTVWDPKIFTLDFSAYFFTCEQLSQKNILHSLNDSKKDLW